MSASIKVLGLDAAFANVGMALATVSLDAYVTIDIDSLDLIVTKAEKSTKKVVRKNSDDLRRAKESATAIRRAIEENKVALVMVEVPSGAQSARAAWSLGIVVGLLGSLQVPVIELSPREVKLVTGDRLAEKEDMIAWAEAKHPKANWPRKRDGSLIVTQAEHMADAVATLHAGILTEEFGRMKAVYRSLFSSP